MKKNLLNVEIVSIINWYKGNKALACLPLKTQWAIKKNIKVLNSIAEEYDKFQSEIRQSFQNEWFTQEKADEVEIPELNDDGSEKKDENGNVITQKGLRIKSEFFDDFKVAETNANKQLEELLMQTNELELSVIDIDSVVEGLPQDTEITMNDLDYLSAFCCE